MICKNYRKIGFGIFLLVLPVVLSVLFSLNTSAVADLTYTFDFNSIPSWYDLCQGSSDCSSYNYLKVEPSNPSSCQGASYFYMSGLSSSNVSVSVCISSLYFLNSPNHIYLTGGKTGVASGDITIILSESFGSVPSGSINISSNGTYNVTDYSEAVVNIPETVIQGDYHDDLVNIYHAIILCGGVILVLYFFYCIYRMIIRAVGGKQ